jgi:aspartate aminotransferase/aminotransferase
MVAPGSYFGMSPNNGFVRITCSGTSEQLKEMMDRIETRLLTARKNKAMRLVSEI